jgi:hypothetical protein
MDEMRFVVSFLLQITTMFVTVWFVIDANWGPATLFAVVYLYLDLIVERNHQVLKDKGKV